MPRTFFMLFSIVFSLSAFALTPQLAPADETQSVEFFEPGDEEHKSFRIKEIKKFTNDLHPELTCMDDYLKRRKRLALRFAVTPLLVPVSTMGGILAGSFSGAVSYGLLHDVFGVISDPSGGWRFLGYVVIGAGLGGLGSGVYALTDTGIKGKEFVENERLLKALMESYQGTIGPVTTKLHKKLISKYPQSFRSLEAFQEELLELDKRGFLCDGSLRKKKVFSLAGSLSKRLARTKDIFRYLVN